MSIRNVTCEAFVANNTCASNEQFASFLDLEEIMSEVWTRQAPVLNKKELGSTRIIWLVDLVGDSFNRGQYLVLPKYLAGLRIFPDDTIFGQQIETYHKHHIFCCHSDETKPCGLALSHYSFNGTIHEQLLRQGSELIFGSNSTSDSFAVCVSWQWSKYSTDETVVSHLKRHHNSSIRPQTVVLNQGLHCSFRWDYTKLCSDNARQNLNRIMKDLHKKHGIRFAVDTAALVTNSIQGNNSIVVNSRTRILNDNVRRSFTNDTVSIEHVWIRDIERWSEALDTAQPKCREKDGVHFRCTLFHELSLTWLMNYVTGHVLLDTYNPLNLWLL